MSWRTPLRAMTIGMVGLLVLPAAATIRVREIAFPPGFWEGSVLLSGSYTVDGVRSDGTKYRTVRTVTASGTNFELLVDAKGQVTDGGMEVDISWTDEGTGTTPGTRTPYNIRHVHRQTGTLDVTGTAARLVAAGTLDWDTQTYDSSGDLIEEVSGTEPADVRWVFSAAEANCAAVTGKLLEATGKSLMASALLPRAVFEDTFEALNELVALFWAWPTVENPNVLADAVNEVAEYAEEVLTGVPTVEELMTLIQEVEALRLELARLKACQIASVVPQATDTWLAAVLRTALESALKLGEYTAQELIALLNIGVRGQAVNAALYQRFGEALGQALDNAVEAGDAETIRDIAAAAARYGYSVLHADAVDALATLSGTPK